MLERFRSGIALALFAVCLTMAQSASAVAAGKIPLDPKAIPLIDRAVVYLESEHKKGNQSPLIGGRLSLAGYAILKVGRPVTHPVVAAALKHIEETQKPDVMYKPASEQEGVYEGGVDLMLLAEADPEKYRPLMQQIVNYLVSKQIADGSWTYPNQTVGDTSMSQYAILGFWAAERSGIEVPLEVWNNAAKWHMKTQLGDGGFAYHPGTTDGAEQGASTHNLTNAAGGSLLICRLNMYPQLPSLGQNATKAKPPKKFGVLENAEEAAVQAQAKAARAAIPDMASAGQIEASAARALGWMNARYVMETPNPHKFYFYYTIERFASLAGVNDIGGKPWFYGYLDVIKQKQKADGSWDTYSHPVNATSLALLFLARATGKVLMEDALGGGLLAGGRGLPDDLGGADTTGGKIKERKVEGDLDRLLTDFDKLDLTALEDTQTAIVEKIQLGSREELLGEMPRIRKLIDHPNPEIRRTAVWALGRSGDLKDANLLIQRLEEFDVDVLTEANNALCYLSRKLAGIGVPENPFEGLPETPTQAQKDAAMAAWKKDAIAKWTTWYIRVRPYDDRNDLFQLKFGGVIKK